MRSSIPFALALLILPTIAVADVVPPAETFYDRGNNWSAKGEYDKAIAEYDQAVTLDPNRAEFYVVRGNARLHRHEFDKAVADFNEAIRLDPDDVRSLWLPRMGFRGQG